jgi:hypothetical protein
MHCLTGTQAACPLPPDAAHVGYLPAHQTEEACPGPQQLWTWPCAGWCRCGPVCCHQHLLGFCFACVLRRHCVASFMFAERVRFGLSCVVACVHLTERGHARRLKPATSRVLFAQYLADTVTAWFLCCLSVSAGGYLHACLCMFAFAAPCLVTSCSDCAACMCHASLLAVCAARFLFLAPACTARLICQCSCAFAWSRQMCRHDS